MAAVITSLYMRLNHHGYDVINKSGDGHPEYSFTPSSSAATCCLHYSVAPPPGIIAN